MDTCGIAGTSKASFYRVIWKTVDITATVIASQLRIQLPKTEAEPQRAISGFASLSFNQATNNCVGVVDGFLSNIRVNIQAVADHQSRFLYFAVAAPGVSKDRDACEQCGLMTLMEKLPFGLCAMGDAAYEPT